MIPFFSFFGKNEIQEFLNAIDFQHEEKIKRKLDILTSTLDNPNWS
jgi:hypothetical protein